MTNDTAPQARGPRADLISGWTDLWNGRLDVADRICAPRVTVCFGGRDIAVEGDRVATPADLARLIGGFRAARPGLTYRVVEARTTQTDGYCVWNAIMGELEVGGIDTFTFHDAGISRVYSVTGQRPLGRGDRVRG